MPELEQQFLEEIVYRQMSRPLPEIGNVSPRLGTHRADRSIAAPMFRHRLDTTQACAGSCPRRMSRRTRLPLARPAGSRETLAGRMRPCCIRPAATGTDRISMRFPKTMSMRSPGVFARSTSIQTSIARGSVSEKSSGCCAMPPDCSAFNRLAFRFPVPAHFVVRIK